MKLIIAVLSCALSISAFAQSDQEKSLTCRLKGEIFKSAAFSRDHGMSPETAYGMASGYLSSGMPDINKPFLKNTINVVYFDPSFSDAGGQALSAQVTEICLTGGKPRYQPLK